MRGLTRKFWCREAAPEVDLDWFRERGVTDPEWAFNAWRDWLKDGHSPETQFRKALALAVGVEVGAVSHYLTHWENPNSNRADHLSQKTLKDLDDAALSLGCRPPYPFLEPIPMQEGGQKRILLFAELSPIPSTRFHVSVLESITDACDQLNISLEVRSLPLSDRPMAAVVKRVLKCAFPDGFIWLRITPDQESLDAISRYSARIPCVLLHASRLQYPSPVVAHVVPDHSAIGGAVVRWVRGLSQSGRDRCVTVAAMQPDRVDSPFPLVGPEVLASIREERIVSIVGGLESCGVAPTVVSVSDYSASQAAFVLTAMPNAAGYICLSDEIAVGISQLLAARGEDPTGRVLGFDGSALAKKHWIPSFDQQLLRLGHEVVTPFVEWFRNGLRPGSGWPQFREIPVLVNAPSAEERF